MYIVLEVLRVKICKKHSSRLSNKADYQFGTAFTELEQDLIRVFEKLKVASNSKLELLSLAIKGLKVKEDDTSSVILKRTRLRSHTNT